MNRLLLALAAAAVLAAGAQALEPAAGASFRIDSSAAVASGAHAESASFQMRGSAVGIPASAPVSSAAFAVESGQSLSQTVAGDLNNDGAIDLNDAQQLLLVFAAKQAPDYISAARSDVDNDQSADNKDAQKVRLFADGTLAELPDVP